VHDEAVQPDLETCRGVAAGVRDPHVPGPNLRTGVPDADQRLSTRRYLRPRADVRPRRPVGQEHHRGRRLRARDAWAQAAARGAAPVHRSAPPADARTGPRAARAHAGHGIHGAPDRAASDAVSFDLERFVEAQAATYPRALAELREGRKRTHWMWFVFPQLAGLGRTETSRLYAIASLNEARA